MLIVNHNIRLSANELQELRKYLAKEYDLITISKGQLNAIAEKVSTDFYEVEKQTDFRIYKSVKLRLAKALNYFKNLPYKDYKNEAIEAGITNHFLLSP